MTRTLAYALAVMTALFGLQSFRLHHAEDEFAALTAKANQARADAESAARDTEAKLAVAAADAADQYERGKSDAKTAADALLVDLLTRNVSLHARWQCPSVAVVPATAATARELNAADADRAASASRIVRAAKECAAQVEGLQKFIRDEREVSR